VQNQVGLLAFKRYLQQLEARGVIANAPHPTVPNGMWLDAIHPVFHVVYGANEIISISEVDVLEKVRVKSFVQYVAGVYVKPKQRMTSG
jgi:hypothetical protein